MAHLAALSGKRAEQAACDYLTQQGLTLIEKNYRTRCGEIDLIMKDKNFYVFIEVRLRNNLDFASSIESITASKQKKIIKTALFFLQQHRLLNKVPCRFDVVGAIEANQTLQIQWIKNAFATKNY